MIKLTGREDPLEMKRDRGQDTQPCSECTHQEGLYGREMQLKRRAGCWWALMPSYLGKTWEAGRKKVMLRGQRQRVGCGEKLKHRCEDIYKTAQDNKRGFSQAHEAGPTTLLMKSCEAVRSMQDHTNPTLIFL